MKQLGNLAVICARRADVLMQIYGTRVSVYVGKGPDRETICMDWNDDTAILDLIKELNFGMYAPGPQKPNALQLYFDTMKALPSCNTCRYTFCQYRPKPGQADRVNCPFWCEEKEVETL